MSNKTSSLGDRAVAKDALAGIAVAVAGAVLLVSALSFQSPSAQADAFGPKFFPLLASGVLVLGGLSLTLSGLRRTATSSPSEDEGPVPIRRLAIVVGIFAGYLLIFVPVGFLVSTTLFMTVMTTFARPDRTRLNLVVAAATSSTIYYSFTQLLDVGLPAGVLG